MKHPRILFSFFIFHKKWVTKKFKLGHRNLSTGFSPSGSKSSFFNTSGQSSKLLWKSQLSLGASKGKHLNRAAVFDQQSVARGKWCIVKWSSSLRVEDAIQPYLFWLTAFCVLLCLLVFLHLIHSNTKHKCSKFNYFLNYIAASSYKVLLLLPGTNMSHAIMGIENIIKWNQKNILILFMTNLTTNI